MTNTIPNRLTLVITFLITLFSCNTRKSPARHVWESWEMELTSTRTYDNPYKDISLSVEYTGPGNETFTSPGFWNGQSVFIIRSAFPSAGKWIWNTSCSDTSNMGLHNQSGEVTVEPYNGSNPLYKNGFLRVSDNKRYLTFHNMDPFLWVGGTAWIAPLRASFEDWKIYIDDCADKKISVVQISPASSWGGDSVDVRGNPPFFDKGLNKWNPAYWDGFDKKVQYANEKGVVVFIVGLMEPVERYPSEESASLFARNLTARMSGNFVVLSPSFDSRFMELGNTVGNVLNNVTSRHLITQHPGTPSRSLSHVIADRYYNEDYLDFSMCQSGHNRGNRNWCVWQAVHWNLDLYSRGEKPVINGEAYYEADTIDISKGPAYRGTAKDARQLGYMSFLSGSLGYTYGALGLWNWETDSTKGSYWKKAMRYPGRMQMQYMSEFFAEIDWWKLEPKHNLILNQRSDTLSVMTLAKSPGNDLLVAYLPKTDTIQINLDDFSFPAKVTWFDPIANKYIAQGIRTRKDENEFISPGLSESILLLKK
ncbi:MAG: DUF4038 domain-containing protein [Cyclobacteriaceae bacterium]